MGQRQLWLSIMSNVCCRRFTEETPVSISRKTRLYNPNWLKSPGLNLTGVHPIVCLRAVFTRERLATLTVPRQE
ncbi:hypothetical protein J6590_044679 [Homalodisca vitripennis]|nr:hypothetical protein J6590_044679 [Homalodisca vitripennis]